MSKIHKLTDLHFLQETWSEIFVSNDPFAWPFADRIKSGLIFYPTEGYHLTEGQYKAMVAAAKSAGDDGFIFSITEGAGNIVERGEDWLYQHWWCEFPPYDEYLRPSLNLENCVYSRNAIWGIMISHEDHAVVGGDSRFVAALRAAYPQWQDDTRKLIETWKDNPHGSWIGDLLRKCSYFDLLPGGRDKGGPMGPQSGTE